jgi:hypothetical protein
MERHAEVKAEEKKRREGESKKGGSEPEVEEIWRKAARHELGQEEDSGKTDSS